MKTRFDEQLEEMHIDLIKMGSLCEEVITLAVKALDGAPEETLQNVYNIDREIDQKERDIENICMRLLLLERPFAGDMRKISAALKMISDMERIGDQAADIVDMIPYIAEHRSKNKTNIGIMGRAAVKMVTESVEAFVQDDLALANKVIADDDEVDTMFGQVKTELIQAITDKSVDAQAALDLLMTAKYFERIADHAVNIAEWVVFSITGIHISNE